MQHSLDQAVRLQREFYPDRHGLTRWQRYPDLALPGRPYHPQQESQLWSLQRVYHHLEQGCWQRQVDGNGTISLYNRNYTVGRALARQKVWVRFSQGEWVIFDVKGTEVTRLSACEINTETIQQLRFARPNRH